MIKKIYFVWVLTCGELKVHDVANTRKEATEIKKMLEKSGYPKAIVEKVKVGKRAKVWA